MSVYVTLLPTAIPPAYLDEAERAISYEDRTTGEDPIEYQHAVSEGGVLSVWRVSETAASVLEVRYGPAAWETVQGAVRR